MTPAELPAHWRAQAEHLRRFAPTVAEAFDVTAKDLEEALAKAAVEELTLEAAAAECGYSADHLGALIRSGKLENLGRKHAPKVRRRDLPRKPRRPPQDQPALADTATSGATLARITRDALAGRGPRR